MAEWKGIYMIFEHQMEIKIQSLSFNNLILKSRDEYLLIDIGGRVATIKDKLDLDKIIEFLTYHRNNT